MCHSVAYSDVDPKRTLNYLSTGYTAILAVSARKHLKQPQTSASKCPENRGKSMPLNPVSDLSGEDPLESDDCQ